MCRTILVWGVLACAARATAADVVVVASADGRRSVRRTGQIQDYSGSGLTLVLSSGRPEEIPEQRVLAVETPLVPDHAQADQQCRAGHYAQALTSYRRALSEEPRSWMQQRILADMVQCYQVLGQVELACENFLILTRNDPNTPWFDRIPLTWSGRTLSDTFVRQAAQWLHQADQPVAQLLAASWLQSGAQRAAAVEALQQLARHSDRRIRALAQAQMWRTKIATATAEDVTAWQADLAGMERELRGGGCFVVGSGWLHVQQPEQAALMLMRVPILFPQLRDLAAESLWAAGEALEAAGHPDEARGVWQELSQHYPQHPLGPTAQQRLERASGKSS